MKLKQILKEKQEVVVVDMKLEFDMPRNMDETVGVRMTPKELVQMMMHEQDSEYDMPDSVHDHWNETVKEMFHDMNEYSDISLTNPEQYKVKKNAKGEITMIVINGKKHYI